jgi:hypothetical protein
MRAELYICTIDTLPPDFTIQLHNRGTNACGTVMGLLKNKDKKALKRVWKYGNYHHQPMSYAMTNAEFVFCPIANARVHLTDTRKQDPKTKLQIFKQESILEV